jgi:ankyrin repeat protein
MPRQIDLFHAAASGNTKEIDKLAEGGININGVLDGETALHVATTSVSIPGTRRLVERGAALDALDRNGMTPLMIACNMGDRKGSAIALMLIEAGCNTRVRRDDGMSSLEFAVKRCSPEVVRRLIVSGLPVDGPKGRKLTPAMVAARAGNVETLGVLIEQGAKLSLPCELKWAKGMTCLQIAELEKREKVVRFLRSHLGILGRKPGQ